MNIKGNHPDTWILKLLLVHDGLTCVWSRSGLGTSMHIDHALPFSMWQNNNLWNLFSVTGAVNLRKGIRIPALDLIEKGAQRLNTVV